ncbi:hypothetical protein [Amycolatopsis jiangsuensis]|uniref:CHAP domain-containing protein n=1 Tax=Amycolatopsis jiangsuensis TaxID=1181879 RepID=A0A840J2P3_9PSEU|nr:hypothetical protein [Amycolatopsis jiangsuensis]MBB4689331.1 hypothetical protein [Amycolatopsis jiangsuensis]
MSAPAHLRAAEDLIDHVRPEDNRYKTAGEPDLISWAPRWRNHTQCASFQTQLLKRVYDWADDEFFATHFGSVSPPSRTYRWIFARRAVPHFAPVHTVRDLRPGDLVVIDYGHRRLVNTGHIAAVREPPRLLEDHGYVVPVADCTADPHGSSPRFPDSRSPGGQGAGYGHLVLHADPGTGSFAGYAWSVTARQHHHVTDRPITAVRIPSP